MNKKFISALIAVALAITLNTTAYATPSSAMDKMKQQEVKVETLDNQISVVTTQIEDNKKTVDKLGKQIKEVQKEIQKSEEAIKSQQELFNKRVRAMYINGNESYLSVILEANSIGDFLGKVDAVKKVMEYDNKIVSDYKEKQKVILKKKQAVNNENTKVLALKSDNEKKLSKLNEDKKESKKLLQALKDQQVALGYYEENNPEILTAMGNVNSIKNNASSISPSRGQSSMSSSNIVAYASNFLGRPYQWGGNGPNSFDCSGFTVYVYAHFGVSLPRVASDQQGVGTPVSSNDLQPGDLVFFGSPAHHVGIYVGGGCYIHAPQTGDVIKISSMNRTGYSGARRVK